MCAEAKTNRVSSVSRDLNTIEQLLDELWRRIQDQSVQHRILRQLQVSLHLRMGVDYQERCAASYAFGSTSL